MGVAFLLAAGYVYAAPGNICTPARFGILSARDGMWKMLPGSVANCRKSILSCMLLLILTAPVLLAAQSAGRPVSRAPAKSAISVELSSAMGGAPRGGGSPNSLLDLGYRRGDGTRAKRFHA